MFEDAGAGKINIELNGEPREIPAGQTLPDLLAALELHPQAVLVEINGRALLRTEWPDVALADRDRLEVLRVVAGG
jgi:sulfur carrier protein